MRADARRWLETIDLTARELPRFGWPVAAARGRRTQPARRRARADRREDDEVIAPPSRRRGRAASTSTGPLPADTVFVRADAGRVRRRHRLLSRSGIDPVKLLAFGASVNVTLGLPIVRTSVDHGTAFDIAGKDVADPSSMIEAMRLAARLAQRVPPEARYRVTA